MPTIDKLLPWRKHYEFSFQNIQLELQKTILPDISMKRLEEFGTSSDEGSELVQKSSLHCCNQLLNVVQ